MILRPRKRRERTCAKCGQHIATRPSPITAANDLAELSGEVMRAWLYAGDRFALPAYRDQEPARIALESLLARYVSLHGYCSTACVEADHRESRERAS